MLEKLNFNDYKYYIIILLIITFLFYLLSVVLTKNKNCENILSIRKEYTKFDEYVSFQDQIDNDYFIGKIKINDETINYNYKLKDFFIKTAYNCCCTGKFKNDYVELCALENCASYGVRGLHFQLYSLDSVPIVAASSVSSNFIKETYNYINLKKAMEHVRIHFLSNESNKINYANNEVLKDDPLFLFFTIHYSQLNNFPGNKNAENREKYYNKIYNILCDCFGESKFNSKIIGNIFSGFQKH